MNCPCCRQVLPTSSEMLIDVDSGIIVRNGAFAAMTRQEFSIFEALQNAAPRLRSREQLLSDLYWREADDPEIKIIDVFICKLRKKLSPLDIKIETAWGRGYRLIPFASRESEAA